jgi:hypothetical protein
MNYSLSNMLGRGGVRSKPVISGFAYPLETLTASRAGQWSIDGVPVIGQTGTTFQVPLLAYGRTITCDNSAPVVVWKPWDIAGVVSVRVADRGVLNAVSPDVVATNNQTVRRWNGLVSAQPADQTNSAFQPIWRATEQSGNPSLEFDGVDDVLNLSEAGILQSLQSFYAITGARDINPTGGTTQHAYLWFSTSTGVSQVTMNTRAATGDIFNIGGRRLPSDGFVSTTGVASDSNYHVHTGEFLYSLGQMRQRLDGQQVSSANFTSGAGLSDSVASPAAFIGRGAVGIFFPGHITCVILANQLLSATDRSRLERFAGLFGGLNIPLV